MATKRTSTKGAQAAEEAAMKLALGSQRPGQTKEQTRLIAQGIRKGIELYKKQQATKARELDRKLKRLNQQLAEQSQPQPEPELRIEQLVRYRQHWLPWVLLLLTWAGIGSGAYLFLRG